jgi:hypothetical protein
MAWNIDIANVSYVALAEIRNSASTGRCWMALAGLQEVALIYEL